MSSIILPYKGITPTIDPSAYIAPNTTIIGDVHIGAESSIWPGCVVRGDVHEIRIGARTNIQDGSVIHVTHETFGTYVGDDVTVGHMALLHACTVEDLAFVGMKACVMDGAVIESRGMLAAGALLTPGKVVPGGQLWAGSPARYMRDLSAEDLAHFKYSADHYAALAKSY